VDSRPIEVKDYCLAPTVDWRESYKALTPGLTAGELQSQLVDVEGAIFIRLQQLSGLSDGAATEERRDISDAMQTIRRLQIEKLNYPNFNPAN
jgi:hypothetical protein